MSVTSLHLFGRDRMGAGESSAGSGTAELRLAGGGWRQGFGLVVGAAAFGCLVQVLNVGGVTGIWRVAGIVLECAALWCVPAFVSGGIMRTTPQALRFGVMAELSAIVAYYVTSGVCGIRPWGGVCEMALGLAPLGSVVGLLFGAIGRSAMSDTPRRHLWRMAIPAVMAVEALMNVFVLTDDPVSEQVAVGEFVVAAITVLGLVVVLARERLDPPVSGK